MTRRLWIRQRGDKTMTTEPEPADTPEPAPHPDLANLQRLVGTWQISGGAQGEVTYEWMPGGFFLVQRFRLTLFGHTVEGIEIIGHERPFGQEPSADIRSRAYDNSGSTLDYVYELDGDVLTIWGGDRGSKSFFTGTFSEDGNVNSGEWVYEGGGGYATTMRRSA
jgi:hypothetical protein